MKRATKISFIIIFFFIFCPDIVFSQDKKDISKQVLENSDQSTQTAQSEKINEEPKDEIPVDIQNAFELYVDGDLEEQAAAEEFIIKYKPPELVSDLFSIIEQGSSSLYSKTFDICKSYPLDLTADFWINTLIKTEKSSVKIELIQYLSSLDNSYFVKVIADQLDDSDYSVRTTACIELQKIRNDLAFIKVFQMADSENPLLRLYAAQSLIYLYDIRFDPFLIKMMDDSNKSVRLKIIEIIEKHNLDNLHYLVKRAAQYDSNYEVRIQALEMFIRQNNKSALYLYPRLLKDSNSMVRYTAVKGISHFYYVSMSYALSKLLETETDPSIINIVIDTLIKFKNAGGYSGIETVLQKNNNPYLRRKAVYAVSLAGGYKADDILIEALKDNSYLVRAEAAGALSQYKKNNVAKSLIFVLTHDKEDYVRSAALYSILEINFVDKYSTLLKIAETEKNPVLKQLIMDEIKKYKE